jgi:hypothetical protein
MPARTVGVPTNPERERDQKRGEKMGWSMATTRMMKRSDEKKAGLWYVRDFQVEGGVFVYYV